MGLQERDPQAVLAFSFHHSACILDQQRGLSGDFISCYPQPLHHVYLEPCGELLTAFLCVADP